MKLSNTNQTFTFDDVQIIPQYSDVASRSNCNTSTLFTENYLIDIPLIASPMASICELEMAYEMWRLGGVGIVHRFNTIEEQSQIVSGLKKLQKMKLKTGSGLTDKTANQITDFLIFDANNRKSISNN